MYTQMKCPYCGKDVHLVTGEEIYPHRNDLHMKNFWLCKPCNAYTGTHDKNLKRGFNGTEPLGTLANAKLRKLRKDTHAVFDLIWQEKYFTRSNAYEWLAKQMNIHSNKCHIAMFDEAQCNKAINICETFLNNPKGTNVCKLTQLVNLFRKK